MVARNSALQDSSISKVTIKALTDKYKQPIWAYAGLTMAIALDTPSFT